MSRVLPDAAISRMFTTSIRSMNGPVMTPTWLSAALGTSVRAVEWHPVGEGLGFMGDVLRLTLDHDDPAAPFLDRTRPPGEVGRGHQRRHPGVGTRHDTRSGAGR